MSDTKQNPEEQAFLREYQAQDFERPSVTVDVAIVTVADGELRVLCLKRPDHPFKGAWALPGGFVRMNESLEETAARVMREKAGLEGVFLEQLETMGEPARDPRTRVITVVYYALVDAAELQTSSGADIELCWLSVPWKGERGGSAEVRGEDGKKLPVAFDHAEILGLVMKRLRGKLDYAPIGFELLPERFTLRELQEVHEAILSRKLNKHSFRRKVLASGLVSPTGALEQDVDFRPAQLFRFKKPRR